MCTVNRRLTTKNCPIIRHYLFIIRSYIENSVNKFHSQFNTSILTDTYDNLSHKFEILCKY